MVTQSEHLENLLRHKEKVKDSAIFLAHQLIKQSRTKLARKLIARGYSHDNSKLEREIEWRSLHVGSDVPKNLLDVGINHHQKYNRHHPLYHHGFDKMDELSVAELSCDILSRSQEFGTDLRKWIEDIAIIRYSIDKTCVQYKWLMEFVDLLLE